MFFSKIVFWYIVILAGFFYQVMMGLICFTEILNSTLSNENVWISIGISLPKTQINNKSALFQIMAWRLIGDKPLSEPMMAYLTEGVFPLSVTTWRDSCVRAYAPLTLASPLTKNINKIEQVGPSSPLEPSEGAFEWRMGLPASLDCNLGCRIVYFPLILHSLWGVSYAEYIWP